MPQDQRSPTARYLRILAHGEVEVLGRLPWSSNHTFLTTCCEAGEETQAVYKPAKGERRLWDFPEGVYRREVAAYVLSEMLGWGVVPETVDREDAPFGPGSMQRFVPSDFSQHHFTLVEEAKNHPSLRAICAFDVVANNADRKSGHCLLGDDGRIWAIDNGLCFHREPKLRTVIWEFAGEALPQDLVADLERLPDDLPGPLEGLLTQREIAALGRRTEALASDGVFPLPDPDRYHYPWPLV